MSRNFCEVGNAGLEEINVAAELLEDFFLHPNKEPKQGRTDCFLLFLSLEPPCFISTSDVSFVSPTRPGQYPACTGTQVKLPGSCLGVDRPNPKHAMP